MNIEIEVGQVWNDPFFGEIKVIAKENDQVVFQKADGKFIILNIKSPEWGKYLTLMRDMETKLSDLEIVQKALECSDGYLSIDSDGCWQIVGNTNIIGGEISSLLAWAKQTIGEELV